MKAVIVDDNAAVRRNLTDSLQDFCPDIDLIGEATNVMKGLALINAAQPDLVFLDVEMPDGQGFDLLKKLPNCSFQLIFITAHEKYAMRAIKFSALDYLLKPIDPDDLIEAVEKAKVKLEQESTKDKIDALLQNVSGENSQPSTLVLKDKYGVQIVAIKTIIRLEAGGSYTQFFIDGQKSLLISKGIKEYENLLSPDQFFRCHQSHIVNMDYVSRYDKRGGDFLHLTDGSEIPLATRKRDILLQKINAK